LLARVLVTGAIQFEEGVGRRWRRPFSFNRAAQRLDATKRWSRARRWSLSGRIFCGEPVSTSPENALPPVRSFSALYLFEGKRQEFELLLTPFVGDKAGVVIGGRNARIGGAAMERGKFVDASIVKVGRNHVALSAVGRSAKAIDLAL